MLLLLCVVNLHILTQEQSFRQRFHASISENMGRWADAALPCSAITTGAINFTRNSTRTPPKGYAIIRPSLFRRLMETDGFWWTPRPSKPSVGRGERPGCVRFARVSATPAGQPRRAALPLIESFAGTASEVFLSTTDCTGRHPSWLTSEAPVRRLRGG